MYINTYYDDWKRNCDIIDAYGNWVQGYFDAGYEAYIISLMFNFIPGTEKTRKIVMAREVDRVYATMLTRLYRKPGSREAHSKKPFWIACPDYPVPKSKKLENVSLRDVFLNDGLHFQLLGMHHPGPTRMKLSLEQHFAVRARSYVRPPLLQVHVRPVTESPKKVIRYLLKSIKRRRSSLDDILVLPRSGSESSARNEF